MADQVELNWILFLPHPDRFPVDHKDCGDSRTKTLNKHDDSNLYPSTHRKPDATEHGVILAYLQQDGREQQENPRNFTVQTGPRSQAMWKVGPASEVAL